MTKSEERSIIDLLFESSSMPRLADRVYKFGQCMAAGLTVQESVELALEGKDVQEL